MKLWKITTFLIANEINIDINSWFNISLPINSNSEILEYTEPLIKDNYFLINSKELFNITYKNYIDYTNTYKTNLSLNNLVYNWFDYCLVKSIEDINNLYQKRKLDNLYNLPNFNKT